MARVTRTFYPGERNKGLSSTFQQPEEDQSVQRPKRCDKHGEKDGDNSPKNVNNVHNGISRKYKQIYKCYVVHRIQCWQSESVDFLRC